MLDKRAPGPAKHIFMNARLRLIEMIAALEPHLLVVRKFSQSEKKLFGTLDILIPRLLRCLLNYVPVQGGDKLWI